METTHKGRKSRIKDILDEVFSAQPAPGAVNMLVRESHRMARAYLLQKVRRGNLQPDFFGLTLDDLALDCLADLFQRDEAGHFVQLTAYFTAFDWQDKEDVDLAIALRRLVFSKVNEGLFRRYREADPSLAKLIRNLKLAVNASSELTLLRRGAELWLVVGDLSHALPMVPPELLEAYLIMLTEGTRPLSEMLSAFVSFTRRETSYCNGYTLTGFAQVIRGLFVNLESGSTDRQEEPVFLASNVERAIQRATDHIKAAKYDSYVGRKKLDEETYDTYFRTVRDILAAQYINNTLPEVSYFEALKRYKPALTETDYRGRHRHILEYITKLTHASLIRYLRTDQ